VIANFVIMMFGIATDGEGGLVVDRSRLPVDPPGNDHVVVPFADDNRRGKALFLGSS